MIRAEPYLGKFFNSLWCFPEFEAATVQNSLVIIAHVIRTVIFLKTYQIWAGLLDLTTFGLDQPKTLSLIALANLFPFWPFDFLTLDLVQQVLFFPFLSNIIFMAE